MRHRTRRALVAATLAAGLLLTACSPSAPAAPEPTDSAAPAAEITIGSMIWNTSVPFYSNFIKGQQETAEALGVKLTIVDGKVAERRVTLGRREGGRVEVVDGLAAGDAVIREPGNLVDGEAVRVTP